MLVGPVLCFCSILEMFDCFFLFRDGFKTKSVHAYLVWYFLVDYGVVWVLFRLCWCLLDCWCLFIACLRIIHLHIEHSAFSFCFIFSSSLFFSRYAFDWMFISSLCLCLYRRLCSRHTLQFLLLSSIWLNCLKTLHLEHCLVSVITSL